MVTFVYVLIGLLFLGLYFIIGWSIFNIAEAYDYYWNFELSDYEIGVTVFWPLLFIVLIIAGFIQFIQLIKTVINVLKKKPY